ALGERALRYQIEFELAFQHQSFEQLVLADVAAGVGDDHSGLQHAAHSAAVNAHVVADGAEVCGAAAHEGVDEVFGDSAQAEAAEHDGGSVRTVGYGSVRAFCHFIQVGSPGVD